MSGLQKTEKIGSRKYRKLGCQANRCVRIGGHRIYMVDINKKPRAVLAREWPHWFKIFESSQIISPSEARKIIGWLAGYIALSDPDPISLSIASTKIHAKEIVREQESIAKELGL